MTDFTSSDGNYAKLPSAPNIFGGILGLMILLPVLLAGLAVYIDILKAAWGFFLSVLGGQSAR